MLEVAACYRHNDFIVIENVKIHDCSYSFKRGISVSVNYYINFIKMVQKLVAPA